MGSKSWKCNETKKGLLMLLHPLANLQIQRYFQNKPKFKDVYLQNNLLNTVQDRTYVVNLDKYKSMQTHWIALYGNGNSVAYFDGFGVEHIPEKIKRFTGNNNITTNIFRTQT